MATVTQQESDLIRRMKADGVKQGTLLEVTLVEGAELGSWGEFIVNPQKEAGTKPSGSVIAGYVALPQLEDTELSPNLICLVPNWDRALNRVARYGQYRNNIGGVTISADAIHSYRKL